MNTPPPPHPPHLRPLNIIARKRDGLALDAEELDWFISSYVAGGVAEEEMAAFLMAVYLRGMTADEVAALTIAMAATGKAVRHLRPVNLSSVPGVKVDKHSTGGVGDKTTLVVAPLVAAAGLPVAKMSGRALAHTGGTIDKLESIPGLSCEMTTRQFVRQVNRIGIAIAAQSADMCPADKRMYALRNRIGAVASIPLIASSVMSKKLAAGADAIVLDVKCGGGAFMKDLRSSRRLARLMVHIGKLAARPTVALVTDMSQPLGRAVGNALEVGEAITVLRGAGPDDVRELSLALGTQMLLLARAEWARLPVEGAKNSRGLQARAPASARCRLESALARGEAFAKFRQMVTAQGGDPRVADDPARLPQAERKVAARAGAAGWVRAIDARAIGEIAHDLLRQAGPGGGVVLLKKRGDKVAQGEPLAMLHGSGNARSATKGIAGAYAIHPRAVRKPRLLLDFVGPRSPKP